MLVASLEARRQWSEAFSFEGETISTSLVDRKLGRRVRPLELRAADGRLLRPADTEVASA